MHNFDWYNAAVETAADDINAHYLPILTRMLEEAGVQGGDVFAAQLAAAVAPAAITPDILLARTPYETHAVALGLLESAHGHDLLEKVADGAYQLTDKGRELAQKIAETAAVAAKTIQAPAGAERLAALLRRAVDASLAATKPAHPHLDRSRYFDPGPEAPVVERIRRYLNDLAAFRDDVHMAAWQAYDLAGHEWEAFSHVHAAYVFGEPAATAEELAHKLGGFRGYDAAAYETALQKVAERGWLVAENGRYAVTREGKQIRDAVEAETNQLFFGNWNFSNEEREELKTLLQQFHEEVRIDA